MADAMWLLFAALAALVGMGVLALSLESHWHHVSPKPAPGDAGKKRLRALGSLSLICALAFCLLADHATMAALVWIMFLAAAAFSVSMLLTWLPGSLRPLSLLAVKTGVV
jgi:hypothetical protein